MVRLRIVLRPGGAWHARKRVPLSGSVVCFQPLEGRLRRGGGRGWWLGGDLLRQLLVAEQPNNQSNVLEHCSVLQYIAWYLLLQRQKESRSCDNLSLSLSLCVCVCVCVYVYLSLCVCVCVCVYLCTYTCIQLAYVWSLACRRGSFRSIRPSGVSRWLMLVSLHTHLCCVIALMDARVFSLVSRIVLMRSKRSGKRLILIQGLQEVSLARGQG